MSFSVGLRSAAAACILVAVTISSAYSAAAAAAPPATADALQRLNPRSSVTAFLQACHANDYGKAAQYLDLAQIPAKLRASRGVVLAKDLESLLNSAPSFDVLRLSQDPNGNLNDDPDPTEETVAAVSSNGLKFTLKLQRVTPASGPPVWLFSTATVAELPSLVPLPSTESEIESRLPRFLVSVQMLETPLWKWFALTLLAAILYALLSGLVRVLHYALRQLTTEFGKFASFTWLPPIIEPVLVLLSTLVFRIGEELIRPSALARIYIGRALLLFVVASFAWGLINLLDYFLAHLDRNLDPKQRLVSRSLLYLGRKVVKAMVAVFAAILILDNWGYNMTTIIAGLGVGGIAVALAAQQTIANVFGGVSVIGDNPISIGDFGNFGGVLGTVEEIGMRSARIRTLNRTVVSIPNSAFAGMNLENFALRDKILFNPILQVKRSTPKEQVRHLMQALGEILTNSEGVEVGPTPVRISSYTAASFAVELFAYVETPDIDEYYKRQAEFFLAIDDAVTSAGVELV